MYRDFRRAVPNIWTLNSTLADAVTFIFFKGNPPVHIFQGKSTTASELVLLAVHLWFALSRRMTA
jgi:hypothetical protein